MNGFPTQLLDHRHVVVTISLNAGREVHAQSIATLFSFFFSFFFARAVHVHV